MKQLNVKVYFEIVLVLLILIGGCNQKHDSGIIKRDRYFAFSYMLENSIGTKYGMIYVHEADGSFPKTKELTDYLKPNKQIVITNIFEFKSKEDYDNFFTEK